MTCKCNCHNPAFRRDTNTSEHATCMECAFALAEEEAWYFAIEKWFDDFIASGGQRPFLETKE